MLDEILEDLKTAGGKAHEALKRDLSRIRTGRASPDILDSLRVDYYGTPTPIRQMANITVPERGGGTARSPSARRGTTPRT